MKFYIIAIIIGLALAFLKIYINTTLFRRDAYERTFACPNCGARFNVKWYQMIYKSNSVYTYNAARLKCPACHIKDMCSIVYDEQ